MIFIYFAGALALVMLIWDSIEVGRNDATNIVNAVIGSRVLSRRVAVMAAGVCVALGAAASSPVVETARKGIFDPSSLSLEQALAIYITVYIVDTALLFAYSAFGMPVSTTASLVFELLGASFVIGGPDVVNWGKSGTVVVAIICSILISGVAGFFVQRAVRGAVGERGKDLKLLLRHGAWIGGGMLASLCYFMLVKGMKHVGWVKSLNNEVFAAFGPMLLMALLWLLFGGAIHLSLVSFRQAAAKKLFCVLAIVGMCAMGFAFGQNDLANCASPGLAALTLIQHRDAGVALASQVPISFWALLGCGILLSIGMNTRYASRVTNATASTGSMANHVDLWAPRWCLAVATFLLRNRQREGALAPVVTLTPEGETIHYDAVRASVILSVSAIVIATASSYGLPVSTTYVAFAAVVSTGMADRILDRGNAELKIARTIWVVFSWFAAALIAALSAGLVGALVLHLESFGLLLALGGNLVLRRWFKKRGDRQAERTRIATLERLNPELFAPEDGS